MDLLGKSPAKIKKNLTNASPDLILGTSNSPSPDSTCMMDEK